MRKVLFPILALLVPGLVIGGVYWKTSRKIQDLYDEQVSKAKAAGISTDPIAYEATLPAPQDNVVTGLLRAAKTADWAAKPIYSWRPSIKDTNAAEPILLEAAKATKAAMSFKEADRTLDEIGNIRQATYLLTNRCKALAIDHRLPEAERLLVAGARIRDLLLQSDFSPLAFEGQELTDALNEAAVFCAAENGKAGADVARRVVMSRPKQDRSKTWRAVGAFYIAAIDKVHELSLKERSADLAQAQNASTVLEAKAEALAWATRQATGDSEAKQVMDGEIAPRATILGNRWNGSVQQVLQRSFGLNAPMGTLITPTRQVDPNLLEWFLRACELGGKAPAGIEQAKTKHGWPLRFKSISGGFQVYALGRDGKNSGGKGDDPFLMFIGHRLNGRP